VNCRSTAEEVRIEECRGYDYYMVGAGAHTLSNSVIMASASNCVVVGGGGATDETCTVQMDQVKVANRRKAAATITIEPRGVFDGRRLTLDGVGVVAAGDWVTLRDSVIGGDPRPEIVLGTNTQWRAERNIYHVQRIRIGDRRYDANEFESYRMATGQDRGSQWRTGDAHE
jgi:hypothetical protein